MHQKENGENSDMGNWKLKTYAIQLYNRTFAKKYHIIIIHLKATKWNVGQTS
jgi:hypothetical protein